MKRYCEMCMRVVRERECPHCGADTQPIPKGVDPKELEQARV